MLGSSKQGQNRVGWRWWLGAALVLVTVLIWIPRPVYAAVGDFVLTHWRTLATGLGILGLAGIAGSAAFTRRRQRPGTSSDDDKKKPLLREIPGWAIWASMASLVAVGLLATWWLVSRYGSGDPKVIEQNRIKLEAIKLAGSVVVGTGGVAALLLAARRQRVSELDLLQRDRIADDNRHDANERRATELYTAAAEQLASDKAPVRMAGMYALSRLGDANENLRQTIVNLLCAYLRMPDISIGEDASAVSRPDGEDVGGTSRQPDDSSPTIVLDLASSPLAALTSLAPDLSAQKLQEHQVRLTAQRLLAQHLKPKRNEDGEPTNHSYWPNMDIDLADANLHGWDFRRCEVRTAGFSRTTFHDDALFTWARFHGAADFDRAEFHELAEFDDAEFHEISHFENTAFQDHASFGNTQFKRGTLCRESQFQGIATFSGATFHGGILFDGTQFHRIANFDDVQFDRVAAFSRCHFHHGTTFKNARFHDEGRFIGAHFYGGAEFYDARFCDTAMFSESAFYQRAYFGRAQFCGFSWYRSVYFHDFTSFDETLFGMQPNFEDARARIDLGSQPESVWPDGYTANEVHYFDDLGDLWGMLTLTPI